jgi:hypothetical protein
MAYERETLMLEQFLSAGNQNFLKFTKTKKGSKVS